MKTTDERLAELERRAYIVEKAVLDMLPRESGAAYVKQLYPAPPPKERPKIEVVKINAPDSWNVTCGEWKWCGDCWVKSDGYWYSGHDARAIAAALEAAGNYPEEYKEKAR